MTRVEPRRWRCSPCSASPSAPSTRSASSRPCDVRTASAVQMLAALAVSLPFALGRIGPIDWHADLIGAMAWSVLVLTLGGSSLLYLLIQRGDATAVTSLLYLVPPCTALMAWVLFGESFTPTMMLGMAFTVAGVAVVVRNPRSSRPDGARHSRRSHDEDAAPDRGHPRRRHRQGNHARGPARARGGGRRASPSTCSSTISTSRRWDYYERHGTDDAGRLEGADRRPRRDLLRRRRLAREDARPRLALGLADASSGATSTSTSTCARRG